MSAAPPASFSARHLPALDGIRGLAIALVLAHNTQMLESPQGLTGRVTELLLDRGWIGVQLFFVLSGFLITGILLDTRESPHYFRNFFVRRALRIFPLYYAALLLMLVVLPRLGLAPPPPQGSALGQWPLWLYFSNWVGALGWPDHGLPHFWSLAVEEQFYLVWPFIVFRLSAQRTLLLCGGVAAASFAARAWMLGRGMNPEAVYEFSICRMDALALGGAAAALVRMPAAWTGVLKQLRSMPTAIVLTAGAGLLLTRGYPRVEPLTQLWGYTLLSVVFAALVLAAAANDAAAMRVRALGWLRCRPLRVLGRYSYGIYVFHKPIHNLVGKPLLSLCKLPVGTHALATMGYVVLCGLASLGVAALSYHLFEARFLELKERWAA